MNIAAFSTRLATIPYNPARAEARGLVAPLIRASGHLLFLLAHISIPETDTHTRLSAEEEMDELTSAASHLAAANVPDSIPTISRATQAHITTFRLAVIDARANWTTWTAEERPTALRDLTNRAAAVGTILDRELAGLASNLSDAGTSL